MKLSFIISHGDISMHLGIKLSIIAASFALSSSAFAQVNVMGTPAYGTYNLTSGFTPDPTMMSVVAGGTVSSSSLPNCFAGNIASVPDVRVNYTAGSYPLRFFVDAPGTDTTIAVNAPDGTWHCNDDFSGLNPAVDFGAPQSGQYDVFVGTYSSGDFPTVNLSVTELPATYGPGQSAGGMPTGQVAQATGGINIQGTPGYGTYNIASGFTPDPQVVALTAGGSNSSSGLMTATGACNAGYVAGVPDVRVNYTSGSYPLRFYVDTPGTDTTLAINAPDGSWHCIDDFSGLHPAIDFASPMSGQYDVFVGTYSQGQYPSVNLSITELPGSYGPGQ